MSSTNDYGTIGEVVAYTRHLLGGESTFNSSTRPTATEVYRFLTRISGIINSALASRGFTVPVTNSDVLAVINDWVVTRAAEYAEATQRGVGFSSGEGSRTSVLGNLHQDALDFVRMYERGWKRLGAGVDQKSSQGLQFTGLDTYSDRSDPDDTSLAQPLFKRRQWDDPTIIDYNEDTD